MSSTANSSIMSMPMNARTLPKALSGSNSFSKPIPCRRSRKRQKKLPLNASWNLALSIMKFQIKFRTSALSEIKSLQPNLKNRVRDAIDSLEKDPRPMGYKKLKGFANLFRIRISNIRVIYSIDDQIVTVTIIKIGNRREV